MAKLVDALDLGSSAVGVRVRSSSPLNTKIGTVCYLFYYVVITFLEAPLKSSSASELRLEQFCDWAKPKKQNAKLPLNANEQDSLFSPKFKERTRF